MWHFKLSDVVQVVYLPVQLISLLTIRLKAPLRDRKGETIWFVFFKKLKQLPRHLKIQGVGQVFNICHEFISEKIQAASSQRLEKVTNVSVTFLIQALNFIQYNIYAQNLLLILKHDYI